MGAGKMVEILNTCGSYGLCSKKGIYGEYVKQKQSRSQVTENENTAVSQLVHLVGLTSTMYTGMIALDPYMTSQKKYNFCRPESQKKYNLPLTSQEKKF